MQLKSFSFSEMEGTDREWSVSKFSLQWINLFVGRNASGKSRVLNCVTSLGLLILRPPTKLWATGAWNCGFSHGRQEYELTLRLANGIIAEETLVIDGKPHLRRDAEGRGFMWAEKLGQDLEFKVPTNSLVMSTRRDEVQHPYLEPLFEWAKSVRKYAFGTEFGKGVIFAALPTEVVSETATDEPARAIDPEKVVELYLDGWNRYRDKFDREILRDLAKVGYQCDSITCAPLDAIDPTEITIPPELMMGRTPLALYLKERDLSAHTRQVEMSMGMYRALALIININHTIRTGAGATILVDDVGEGLDFERSTSLIKLLIEKCEQKKLQLVMSTNDRFIMNEVDLKYWHVVHRVRNKVNILDKDNSARAFERFKFIGLSNFDFFSREAYLEDGQ